ncbi:phosphoglycerate dehydrogenase (plasmid) [Salipiger sp. CCB-MM3]|uniref:2-hydroxyacid dehydrogenase n=1 Tax=Salipiger sp. CCB-MM3 TaxID=1792508 RepID=UPI00080AA03B|nr:2-hydroxyacid dehydrogenase [Salipiger sp. CCB-MM3]ANT63580.1 phosphoglycerate dehydrogenase [Salipiger sp. CCB-MM3]
MKIVFHGANALTFVDGFETLLETPHELVTVSDTFDGAGDLEHNQTAEIIVGTHSRAEYPPTSAKLFQLPAAGYDGVHFPSLPAGCAVCNCFGHENAIAEYVMAALLARHVPLAEADRQLRQGDWHYWAGGPSGLRTELGAQSVGIVGHGHIGSTLAARALAFGMTVHVANRSPVSTPDYAATYGLADLTEMASHIDVLINTLPLSDGTAGIIGADVLNALGAEAIVMNVGRGPVIDEDALFEVLSTRRIGGAIIDTWYVYPTPDQPNPMPGHKPFHDLDNVTLTPHMSGWTNGTITRRQQAMARNIDRLARAESLDNRVL